MPTRSLSMPVKFAMMDEPTTCASPVRTSVSVCLPLSLSLLSLPSLPLSRQLIYEYDCLALFPLGKTFPFALSPSCNLSLVCPALSQCCRVRSAVCGVPLQPHKVNLFICGIFKNNYTLWTRARDEPIKELEDLEVLISQPCRGSAIIMHYYITFSFDSNDMSAAEERVIIVYKCNNP